MLPLYIYIYKLSPLVTFHFVLCLSSLFLCVHGNSAIQQRGTNFNQVFIRGAATGDTVLAIAPFVFTEVTFT